MSKSNGSMNRVFRVVWNAAKCLWQAVCETGKAHGKEKSARSLRRVAGVAGVLFAGGALAAPAANELPSGGKVVGGAASISSSGASMDVLQSSQRAAIDWQTFNIGSAAHVHFEQPSGGAALNRVLDTNASQIYGKLTSTGQVFLVNPNGVLFAPGAQVDVGGLVASTLNISPAAFMAGSTSFAGQSSNAIINQGNITAAPGGSIALIAAKIINDGTLTAEKGNVLLGAGSKVTLDLGGPVKLQIENDALETLIQNGGAIRADGGHVLLTSQAASTLASSVINNTGLIEAQSLMTGEKGEIVLFAHGGATHVSGTLDASGGFIETSGKTLSVAGDTVIKAKTWLIDPENVSIDSSSGAIGSDTVGASVIATALTNGTGVLIQADQDISVNESIVTGAMTSDATLTFNAGMDVRIADGKTIDATQNGNARKLNVYMAIGTATDNSAGADFILGNGASIKTNGGDFVVGGALVNGVPVTTAGVNNNGSIDIWSGSVIDAATGNIVMAIGDGGATGNGAGSVRVSGGSLRAKNITLDAYDNNLVELSGATLEASNGNVEMRGDGGGYGVSSGRLNDVMTTIKADQVSVAAAEQIQMNNTYFKLKDSATFTAGYDVDLSGSFVDFQNVGTLRVNSFQSQRKSDFMLGRWETDDEAQILSWINDDEGTHYTSLEQYLSNSENHVPQFVSLKGGNYISSLFSDGSSFTLNTSTLPILNNGLLAFGNGLEGSVNQYGMLKQPFYYDAAAGRWYKLTYSSDPLAAIIGIGGDGSSEWNINGNVVSSIEGSSEYVEGAFSNAALNTSRLANGAGTVVATNTVTIDGKTIEVTNTYTLPSDKALIAMDTKLKNTSGSALGNVRLWVGAEDDWIGLSDSTTKTRGNLVAGAFVPLVSDAERARALMISGSTSGVLFRTTSEKSNVFSVEHYGSNFYMQDPATSPAQIAASDGAYGVFTRFSDIANGQNESIRWYYGAGSLAALTTLAETVSQQPGNGTPTPPPPPISTVPQQTAVSSVQSTVGQPGVNTTAAAQILSPTAPPPTVLVSAQGSLPVFGVSGGLAFVQVPSPQGQGGTGASVPGGGEPPPDLGGRDPLGFMRVFVIGGGLNLPGLALSAPGQNPQNNANQ